MNMHAGAALSFFGDFLSRHNVNFILDLDSSFFFHFNFTILPSRSLYILQHFRFSLYLPVWYTIR